MEFLHFFGVKTKKFLRLRPNGGTVLIDSTHQVDVPVSQVSFCGRTEKTEEDGKGCFGGLFCLSGL